MGYSSSRSFYNSKVKSWPRTPGFCRRSPWIPYPRDGSPLGGRCSCPGPSRSVLVLVQSESLLYFALLYPTFTLPCPTLPYSTLSLLYFTFIFPRTSPWNSHSHSHLTFFNHISTQFHTFKLSISVISVLRFSSNSSIHNWNPFFRHPFPPLPSKTRYRR